MARTIVKQVKNAVLYSDGTIRLDNVIFSYPHVFEPWAKEEGDSLRFSLTGLMPKDTHKAAKALLDEEIDKILKEKKAKVGADKKFLRDGDNAGKEECEDRWVVAASETPDNPPSVRGPDTKPTTNKKLFYGGAIGSMLIKPWWQDNKHGKRVNASFIACQFIKDGPRFGSGNGAISEDEIDDTFDAHECDEDDSDNGGYDEDDGTEGL